MSIKTDLGQFYTINYGYILKNMSIPDGVVNIIEPFAGKGDLMGFIKNKSKYNIELYDIDPKCEGTVQRDTLNTPPDYTDKFVLTNPPYLARNKSKANKELYDKYNCNDLYKCFITNLLDNECMGGIIIIPLNFISSIRKADIDLRKRFLEKYTIILINIFEEQVFDDTSYAICSMQFKSKEADVLKIKVNIYPSNIDIDLELTKFNNYTIGGEIYDLPVNPEYKIQRATKDTKGIVSNILLKCIDDSASSKLGFKIVKDEDKRIDNTPNLTARSYASLIINKELSLDEQIELVNKMNEFIEEKRIKYNSLFLTNFRESNTIARKRISFDLAYRICNYMISK